VAIYTRTVAPDETRGSAKDLARDELILAQSAFYLDEQGDVEAAALLLDVADIDFIAWERDYDITNYRACLNAPGWLAKRFTPEIIERVESVLRKIAARHDVHIYDVVIGAALPFVDHTWRESLYARLSGGTVTNHAVRVEPDPRLRRDGFNFDSLEEIKVYDALKRAQADLVKHDPANTITIFPLPLGRVGIGSSWTPDFLVVRQGKIGLIEVDGPHHRGRAGADTTRDRHWKNSGVIHIERILVEETSLDRDLDHLVRAFLQRILR